MKTIHLFLFLSTVLAAQEIPWLRVAVSNEEQVLALHNLSGKLLDARFLRGAGRLATERTVNWISENGFVTLRGGSAVAQRLQSAGYHIIGSGLHRRTPPPAAKRVLPEQFGWPRVMDGWPAVYGHAAAVDDFDGDGDREIFLNNVEGFAYTWNRNGTFVLGYPFLATPGGWSTASRETAAAGDINGDGKKELVYGRAIGWLYAHQYTGQPASGFPKSLNGLIWTNEAALQDLDNDGKDEIVLVSYVWPSQQQYGPATVHIFNEDLSEMPGWPRQLPQHSESSPAIGDIDSDGEPEIVVGSGRNAPADIAGEIYAFNLDGSICSGFPILVGPDVNCSPTLYDINLDGGLDILIRVQPEASGINGIYAWDGSGSLLPGFPAVITRGGSKNGVAAVADVNGDGLPEIAYGTVEAVDSARVWLFSNSGQLMPGFPQPVFASWVEESVSLEDVSGDGLADIVCGTNGLLGDPGRLWAFDWQGNIVPDFPIALSEDFSSMETTPAIFDLDGDGDTEIITASHDGIVHVYDSPGIPAGSSWPTFKNNSARTGKVLNPATGISALPDPAPQSLHLYANYPNPFNPATTIRFSLSGAAALTLRVYNLLGQPVAELLRGEMYPAGEHRLRFEGNKLASGIYQIVLSNGDRQVVQRMLLLR